MTRLFFAGLLLTGHAASAAERWDAVYAPHVFKGLPYRLMKPADFDSNQRYPVIISLHGAGGKGT
ncbi:MAG: hypothetical protein VB858_12980, partial [Planctomycetaceae bacterium]